MADRTLRWYRIYLMRFDRRLAFALISLPLACASVETEDGDGSGGSPSSSGGKSGSGGSKSGGASGTGGRASGGSTSAGGTASTGGSKTGGAPGSGGASSDGGTTASGGTTSSGGTASSGGKANTGGAASGGGFSGDCEGKPTITEWRQGSGQKTGDLVVHQCTKKQATCQNLKVGVDSLFECKDSHVPNCTTQLPEDGSAWIFRGECADLVPMGGAKGLGGSGL